MNTIKSFIDKHKGKLIAKQHALEKKYNIDCATNYFIANNGKIYAFDKYNVLMEGNYQIIGTYNDKTCYWRFAWGNPNLDDKLIQTSKKLIAFGEQRRLPILYRPKSKSKRNAFPSLIVASTLDDNVEGYLIHKKPYTSLVIYLLISNTKKPKISLDTFQKEIMKAK